MSPVSARVWRLGRRPSLDGVRVPVLVNKFQAFRAVDEQDPPRCQANWLPAR